MDWYITVIDPATQRVLFAGNSRDRTEIEAVAAEARRLRPQAQIFIRPPMGAPLYEYH
jgi:hypothetical protein